MDIKVNETPIRTSKNFGINNLTLKNLEIPENIKKFDNIEIIKEKSNISYNIAKKALAYGNGKILEKNVQEHANHNIKIETQKEDIRIIYNFDDDNLKLINQIEIIGERDANIIIIYKSKTNKKCFHNGIIKVLAKEKCNLNIVLINLLNSQSENFEAMENKLEKDSKINYTIIDLGGKISISNQYTYIAGENAKHNLKTIYLAKDEQIKDLNYIAEITGKKSNVEIDVQGALGGNSKKNFKGTINFKKGCKKSKGNENEFCLLLSEKAKSIALPILLCTEDEVEGNHSTASGKVDMKTLFHLMSRGISYKEAVKLLVKSNFNKIIEKIPNEEIKEMILNEIDRQLD